MTRNRTRVASLRRWEPATLGWLPRLVAQAPASVHIKLLVAFLVVVALLVAVGAVGLRVLSDANRRAEESIALHRKIAAYRQLQHDATLQLYSVASALLAPDEPTLEATLRQLNQFGYDLDRLQFVAKDELELLDQVQQDHDQFSLVVTQVVAFIRAGQIDRGRELQFAQARPLADRLERRTNELVNRAEADMVTRIEANQSAYVTSVWIVIACAIGSVILALLLGLSLSWSVISPIMQMDARLSQIAAGDFTQRVVVPNRDELGALATNLNDMSVELNRLYKALQMRTHELEVASQHKSAFLANMSHELRTPLNAIIGFSEVLLERFFGELTPKQDEYLQDILSSGRHLLALINDILDLSKVEAGRMELEPSAFDLQDVLNQALTMVRERAIQHNIELQLDVDASLAPIEADERKIKAVIINLLSNAVKFTPDGGRVGIEARSTPDAGFGDKVAVTVWDTGIGIRPEDQVHIFDEFRQAEGMYTQKREGTGLGLALAQKFVELHGGRLWVESQLGRGSRFTFSLPTRISVSPEVAAWPAS